MGGRYIGWSAWAIGASLLTGCMSESGGIEVRSVESASSRIKGGSAALVEAQGLLNLGNPGLALEAFRKIQREQPSQDALAGIAACYVAMGRDDLAKTNLEAALALAPRSAELLGAIALVMDRLDLKAEAANARLQADEILAETKQTGEPDFIPNPHATLPEPGLTVDRDEPVVATPDLPPPASGMAQRAIAEVSKEIRRLMKPEDSPPSITVSLPPLPAPTKDSYARPRIERLSPKEAALVTTGKPYWPRTGLKRKLAGTEDPRWSPVRTAAAPNVRLLNAARVAGLAGAARTGLTQRGWRRIEIGDHTAVRARSLVLYPAGKQRIGMSLARHFGIGAAQTRGQTVTILLGRDVVSRLES